MNLANKVTTVVTSMADDAAKDDNQLQMADEIEKTLQSMGIEVQPRFDIPLAHRLCSIPPPERE